MGKRIAVVFGGVSNENEISIITGTLAVNVLENGGADVLPVYISDKGEMYAGEELGDINSFKDGSVKNFKRATVTDGGILILKKNGKIKEFIKTDVALNCCHGGLGEGGGVCGLFLVNNIPFAGAGMFESAAFMDKFYTKLVLSALGVSTAPYEYIRSVEEAYMAERLGYPLIVKPAKLGSSIGVKCVNDESELYDALACAFEYDDGVILEKYYSERREINCAVYFANGEVIVSECEEALTNNDILNYDDKYAGGGKSVLPADIDTDTSDKIKEITKEVYKRLNMRGIVRFDYILSDSEIILSEINTVPGSLSYYLLSSGFKNFYPVLQAVIAQAECDRQSLNAKKILHTGILNNITPSIKSGRK